MPATEILLFDPARKPRDWSDCMQPGQYAILHVDRKTAAVVDSLGKPFQSTGQATAVIFDTLDDALRYAEQNVAATESICCEIYDHEGKANEPLLKIYNERVRGRYQGLALARRLTFWGAGIIAVGVVWIVIDVWREFSWIWGYVIGAKLVIVGGVLLIRGVVGLIENRAKSQLNISSRSRSRRSPYLFQKSNRRE